MRKKLQRYIVFGLTGLLVLAIAFFSVYLLLRSDEIPYALALEAEFLPTGADLTGVDLSSGFLFVFPGKVKAAAVRQYLTVEPRLELGFHQGRNNREVIISLTEPLKEDKIYTFQLLAEGKILQWAFASKKDFTALGSFPADKSTGVPLDSTISISFSLGNNQGGDEYFQIEPQVEGYFSYAGAVVTFNPRDELTPATIYTVTAREGWPLADSDQVLPQEYSFQFETTDKEPTWEFVDILTSFLPEEEPSLALDLQESRLAEQKAQVRLEKYSDIEDMAEELHKAALEPEWTVYASRRQKPENCSLVASYEIAVENEEGRLWSLALPESLPKGFYLLRVTLGGVERWVRFQVSPINGYVYCQNGGVEIWLHESPGGKPLSDNYEVWDSQTGIINSHIGELGHGSVFVEYTGTAAWLIRAGGPLGEWLAYLPQDEYKPDIWQYLYLDRTAYGHQSTVNYWGFYRPSFLTLDEESLLIYKEVPQSANLILQNRTGDTLYRSDVSINGSTYSGSFDLPNLPAGIYNLSLFVGDKPVSIARLQVADPLEYQGKLSLEPEQPAVFAGDKLTLSFKAEDLLGLPLAGQQVKYTIFAEEYTVTLDDRGEAVVAVQVPFWGNTDISQADITAFLSAETGLALRADSTVTVLNSRIILKSSYRVYPEPALFWLEFYSIDAEAPDHIGEPLAGETVALQIYDHTSEGEAVPLGEETDLTTGESGLTVFDFPAGPLDEGIIRRTARIDFSDTAGRQYQKEIYLYGTGPESGISFEVNGNSANYSATLKSANPNSLSLPGSFLFKNHAVRKHDPTINGGWEQPESQNADVWGIYFNGKQYWPSPRHTLELAPNLHLTCSQDKKEYSPLSHASLKFTVSDQEGRGREARILLSIAGADQARDISLLEDQLPDEAGFIDRETLFFSELKTDKDGVAALELDLPEESGLWQMTVLALDESFNMGQQNSFYWAQGQFILEIDSSGEEEGSDPHLEPEENPLLLNLSQNQPLENGKPDFPDSSSLLWLVFSGPERCRLLSSLWQEAGALGNSLDQRLGAVVARQLLAEAGDWGISLRPIEDFS
ncbi:MAG: Ig-like domain-containing protein, partial [Clostridiales bacterium]|nr:Ig-like domain-containing protein [Clostridiales bacterium]